MPDLGSPISYLVLARGADVYDVDGAHVGTVDHVLADADADIFDGLIVELRPGARRFADADQVAALYERGAVLNVPGSALHEPDRIAATMRATPDDVTEGELHRRLRRAWDYISGNY